MSNPFFVVILYILYNMSNPVFIQQVINNNKLSFTKAMPLKDSTSDGTSDFEVGRKIYSKTYNPPLTDVAAVDLLGKHYFGPSGISSIRPTVFDGTHTPIQKKWMGSANRDSSQITANRRTTTVGKGTLNLQSSTNNSTNVPLSFTNGNDKNLINHTLRRVRGGGAVAPPKKAASPSYTYGPSPGTHPYLQPGFMGKNMGNFPALRFNKPINTVTNQPFTVSP
jgi:hypothetical protein